MHHVFRWACFLFAALLLLTNSSGCSHVTDGDSEELPSAEVWPIVRLDHVVFQTGHGLDIKVIDATTFTCNGVKCRLLGVKPKVGSEKDDESAQKLKQLFDECHNHVIFCNVYDPLIVNDQCVVWIFQGGHPSKMINVELVKLGLVDIDLESNQNYRFRVLTKNSGLVDLNWKESLLDAKKE